MHYFTRLWSKVGLVELSLTDLDASNSLLDSTLDLLPAGTRTSVMPFVEDILAGCSIGLNTDCRLVGV